MTLMMVIQVCHSRTYYDNNKRQLEMLRSFDKLNNCALPQYANLLLFIRDQVTFSTAAKQF
jgi:hypothetical protein